MSKPKKTAAAKGATPKKSRSKPDPADSELSASEEGSLEPGLSFEGALEQLEETVGRLEEGEMPLEEALGLFENGVKLSRQCAETLEAAERRIEILVGDRGDGDALKAEPFETDEFEDDEDFDAE